MKILINGFGRIGRQVFRIAYERGLDVCSINDPLATPESAKLLVQYDSIYGRFPHNVSYDRNSLIIGEKKIRLFNKADLSSVDLDGVDLLVESSGATSSEEACKKIIKLDNAPSIIFTRPKYGADKIIVIGVNDQELLNLKKPSIISTASCDSIAIAPILYGLRNFKIKYVSIVSLHPYVAYQKLLDGFSSSEKLTSVAYIRAAPNNLLPRKAGIEDACVAIIPELKNKINVRQLRVPTPCVSCAFLDIEFEKTVEDSEFKKWLSELKSPIFGINSERLTSIDFCGDNRSVIIDTRNLTISENKLKLMIWYDNEFGYASRIVDIMTRLTKNENQNQNTC